MKIVIAPDSFKGSLSAIEVADTIEKEIKKVLPRTRVNKLPLADGGEGTVETLVNITRGKTIHCFVNDPLGRKIRSFFGILGDKKTAVIEMASASGLPLLSLKERNPLITTTYGTGELIKEALKRGCRKIIIGIGGSATVDGGAGMAQALGAKLLDKKGKELPFGGGNLGKLAKIDLSLFDEKIKKTKVIVASDVTNPLCGKDGAARIYGPQKGATPAMVEILEKNLFHYAQVIKKDLGREVINFPGAGAAGGLGAGLLSFLNAEMEKGVELILKIIKFEKYLEDADLVITGEGKIDAQVKYGKTILGVARLAKRHNIPVIALCGTLTDEAYELHRYGISVLESIISAPIGLDNAMKNAKKLLKKKAGELTRLISLSKNFPTH